MRLIDVDALVLELRELKLVKCTIKRDATPRNSIRWWQCQTLIWFIDALIKNLKDPDRVPTIEAEPVKHGRWVSDDSDVLFHCSECETQISTSWDYDCDEMWNYCPHCGAKMDLEEEKHEKR